MIPALVQHTKINPEAHRPQRSPECTAMKAIFSQNTVNEKLSFRLPWQLIKFNSLDLIHMVVEDYSRNITVTL